MPTVRLGTVVKLFLMRCVIIAVLVPILGVHGSHNFEFDNSYAEALRYDVECLLSKAWPSLEFIASTFYNHFAIPAGAEAPSQVDDNRTMQITYSILRSSNKRFSEMFTGFENGKMIGHYRSNSDDATDLSVYYMKNANSSCDYPPYNISKKCWFFYTGSTLEYTGFPHGKPSRAIVYDPRIRPWYIGAKNSNSPAGTSWSDIYIQMPHGFAAIAPTKKIVTAMGTFIGVTALEMRLTDIGEVLATAHSLFISFIVDESNFLVGTSTNASLYNYTAGRRMRPTESENKVIAFAARAIEDLPRQYDDYDTQAMKMNDGKIYWFKILAIEDDNGLAWNMVVVQKVDCPLGYYVNSSIAQECLKCPSDEGYTSAGGSTEQCDLCMSTYYMNKTRQCKKCKAGMECDKEGTTTDNFVVKKGYYRFTDKSDELYLCPVESHCPGTKIMNSGTAPMKNDSYPCKRGSKGPLCSLCSQNFYLSTWDNICIHCRNYSPDLSAIIIYIIFGLLFSLTVVALTYAVFQLSKKPRCKQVISMFLRILNSKEARRLQRKGRILYVFCQLVSGFSSILMAVSQSTSIVCELHWRSYKSSIPPLTNRRRTHIQSLFATRSTF